jgi:hypothetical protein
MSPTTSFVQHVDGCRDHPGCAVIVCHATSDIRHPETAVVLYRAGQRIWESHFDATVHASHRINPDVPAYDRRAAGVAVRYSPPCLACAPRLASSAGWT